MKRHRALVPLSDDHHHELVQARRLLRATDAPADERLAAGTAYAEAFFTEELTIAASRAFEEAVVATTR